MSFVDDILGHKDPSEQPKLWAEGLTHSHANIEPNSDGSGVTVGNTVIPEPLAEKLRNAGLLTPFLTEGEAQAVDLECSLNGDINSNAPDFFDELRSDESEQRKLAEEARLKAQQEAEEDRVQAESEEDRIQRELEEDADELIQSRTRTTHVYGDVHKTLDNTPEKFREREEQRISARKKQQHSTLAADATNKPHETLCRKPKHATADDSSPSFHLSA